MNNDTRPHDQGERRAKALWEHQFDRSLDYPPTALSKRYVICTSPRCGSHLLGHLLHSAGGFGYPLEYVNAANLEVWSRRAREAGSAQPLDYIKSVRTDRNGVFGIKVHYSHLAAFLEHEPDLVGCQFITLERRNLVKQAVSYAWAAQTKSWISGMPELAPAHYDWELIAQKLAEISRSNAGWRALLSGLGLKACELFYEDVRADPEGNVARVADFLGVSPRRERDADDFFPSEQASGFKHDWVQRFVDDSRERLARGELLARPPAAARGWLGYFSSRLKGKSPT